MDTPEKNPAGMAEIAQLAKSSSAACEEAVEESKVEIRAVPVVAAALVLTTGVTAAIW